MTASNGISCWHLVFRIKVRIRLGQVRWGVSKEGGSEVRGVQKESGRCVRERMLPRILCVCVWGGVTSHRTIDTRWWLFVGSKVRIQHAARSDTKSVAYEIRDPSISPAPEDGPEDPVAVSFEELRSVTVGPRLALTVGTRLVTASFCTCVSQTVWTLELWLRLRLCLRLRLRLRLIVESRLNIPFPIGCDDGSRSFPS